MFNKGLQYLFSYNNNLVSTNQRIENFPKKNFILYWFVFCEIVKSSFSRTVTCNGRHMESHTVIVLGMTKARNGRNRFD